MKNSKELVITINDKVPTVEKILRELDFEDKEKKENKKVVLDITISLPAKKRPKRKVRVFSNFVKIGWDQYSIKHDCYTGYEYVIIDGTRYEIMRNIFGQGYLVEL